MSNSYDQIATVDIEIASAAVDTTNFDNILLVGALPAVAPATAPALCGAYTSLDSVEGAGWVTTGNSADPIGIAARVAFSQKPAPSKIYIAPIQINSSTQVAESAVDTVKRAMNYSGWYVVCPIGVDVAGLGSIATYIETVEKMMIYTDLTFFDAVVSPEKAANKTAVANTFYRTAAINGRTSSTQAVGSVSEENKCMNVAFACAWLAHQSGSETAAFKQMAVVSAGDFGKLEIDAFDTGCCNYMTSIGGMNVSMIGKVLAGEWMDIIRFRDWLKNEIQVSAAKVFLNRAKVPYTDGGISLIQNAVEAALRRGQENEGIMEDEYDDDGNETLGFLVAAPKANSIPDVERQSRKLSGITFRARLAGAIHFTEIKGTVAYSL